MEHLSSRRGRDSSGCILKWKPELEHFVDDKEADSYLASEQRKPFTDDMI